LIRDARSKIFNILILDGLARLSRDNIELNMSIHLFESLGIRVIGVSDGYDSLSASQLFSGSMLKVMNEFFMEEHKEKIKRGKKHAALMRGHTDRCSHDKQVEPCQPSNPS
jgi:DNA invertase Pin-like site-specific DNA recombinase